MKRCLLLHAAACRTSLPVVQPPQPPRLAVIQKLVETVYYKHDVCVYLALLRS